MPHQQAVPVFRQGLHRAVRPADVDGVVGRLLPVQGGHPGQAVIGGEAELVPGDIRYDQGVELSVHLEHTAPVQGDDAAVPLHPGVGALDAGVVQGHRPVAHRHPLPEGEALAQEIVVLHAAVGLQPVQVVLPGDAAVDKDEVR